MRTKVKIEDLDQTKPVAHNFVDRTGHHSGKLTITGYAGKKLVTISGKVKTNLYWICACECGNEIILPSHRLHGHTLSCGCLATDVLIERNTVHGKTNTPEYNNWRAMKERCCAESHRQHRDYGGRGITVCPRWLHSFENFLADMGERPTADHTIDRIDNSRGYSPDNCRWATPTEQGRNKRNNATVVIDGREITIIELSEKTGISYTTLYGRINHQKLSPEEAISKTLNSKPKSCRSELSLTAEKHGIPYIKLWRKVKDGLSIDQAVLALL